MYVLITIVNASFDCLKSSAKKHTYLRCALKVSKFMLIANLNLTYTSVFTTPYRIEYISMNYSTCVINVLNCIVIMSHHMI